MKGLLLALLVCHANSSKITDESIKEINRLTNNIWKAVRVFNSTDDAFFGGAFTPEKEKVYKNASVKGYKGMFMQHIS